MILSYFAKDGKGDSFRRTEGVRPCNFPANMIPFRKHWERGEDCAHTGRLCLLLCRRYFPHHLRRPGRPSAAAGRGAGCHNIAAGAAGPAEEPGPDPDDAHSVRPGGGLPVDGAVHGGVLPARPTAGRPHRPPHRRGDRLAPGGDLRRLYRPGPGGHGAMGEGVRHPLCGRAGGGPASRRPGGDHRPLYPGGPHLCRGGHHLLHRQGHFPPGHGLWPAGGGASGPHRAPVFRRLGGQGAEGGHRRRLPGGRCRLCQGPGDGQPGQPHRRVHHLPGAGGAEPHGGGVRDAPGLSGRTAHHPAGAWQTERRRPHHLLGGAVLRRCSGRR